MDVVGERDKGAAARLARREQILEAARRVFARKGFVGTTIGDIVGEAGIAPGTFYLYFPSKNDVFLTLSERFFESLDQAMERAAVPGGTLETGVRARVRAVFETCEHNQDLVRLVFLNVDPHTREMQRLAARSGRRTLIRWFREWAQTGVIAGSDPEMMARLVNGLVNWTIYECFVLHGGTNAARYEAALNRFIVGALTLPS